VLVHFPLHPETPLEGRALADLFAGRLDLVNDMSARLRALMVAEGLPYGNRTYTYNSRLAQELGKWAETQPGGDAIHDALYRAYFVDNVNLAHVENLVRIAETANLDPIEARDVLTARTWKAAVDEDWQKSAAYGVTGVPTYVAGALRVVGAQPYEILEQLAVTAGAVRR
jgi:predicted DsbA family dithiol-disulfide isomerase